MDVLVRDVHGTSVAGELPMTIPGSADEEQDKAALICLNNVPRNRADMQTKTLTAVGRDGKEREHDRR